MKVMLKLQICALLTLWIMLTSATAWGQTPPGMKPPDTSYQVVLKKIQDKTKIYSQIIEYPEIKGYAKPEAQTRFNRMIKARIQTFAADFKAQALQEAKHQRMPFEQVCTYEIKWQSEKIITLVLTDMVFMGGAHPDYRYVTFNYDFKSSKLIQLSDLFKPGCDYFNFLAQYCSSFLLKKPEADATFINTGTAPEAKNYHYFYLTPKNLVIFFPPVQVACYAAGVQEVPIPYAALKKNLNPRGALIDFLK
jgi:hypothetical protein